jgi:two-component system OmpR family sensor kinase
VSLRWPLTLRLRLSIMAIVLLGVGMIVAGVATRVELRSFLLDRVDGQLNSAQQPVLAYFIRGDTDPGAQDQVLGMLTTGSYAAVLSAQDRIVVSQRFGSGAPSKTLAATAIQGHDGVSTINGYRVAVLSSTSGPGPTLRTGNRLVIMMPLTDVESTLNRLALLELIVGLAVVAGVAIIAYLIVRRELRPLERIEETAAAIAAGDLSRRVDEPNQATEVGSLARSLNAMLSQIEFAFDERRRSEARLRRFVADASHELRTPLTSVRGFAELFRRGAAGRPDDLALAMRRIESEAQRMGVLVEDLLLLANIDQGRPLAQDRFDLRPMLAEMVCDHELLHPGWPIRFVSTGDGEVLGDELRIRQTVANLLANARAHTPAGTEVVVRLATVGRERVIEVKDSGPGIPEEHLDHVFERFFRVDPSRTRASGGSGLGLSIVAAIAEAHGGRAEVSRGEGGGVTFRIALPVDGLGNDPARVERSQVGVESALY